MRLNVQYATDYAYASPPRRVVQLLRVTPMSFEGQGVAEWRIDVDCDARVRDGRDGYGNHVTSLYIDNPGRAMRVTVSGRVLTDDRAGIVAGLPEPLPPPVFLRETPLSAPDNAITAFAREMEGMGGGALERLHRLNGALFDRLDFETGMTDVETPAAQAFNAGHGVCQDFTHIFCAASRLLGIPARYVSGHLFRRDGAKQQSAAHAWVEAWVEDIGWTGFDPSNGISPDDAYIRVAHGLDYSDAAPVSGTRTGGGIETLSVDVRVGQTQSQSQSMGRMRQSQSQTLKGNGDQ